MIYYGADGTPLDSPLDVDLRQATELPRMIECALDLTAPGNEQWRRLLIAEEDLGG
jgi:hypothetical protein